LPCAAWARHGRRREISRQQEKMTVKHRENKQDRQGAGAGSGLTERLARTSALHPWRTIGIWTALIVLAVVAVVTLLGSGLTSDIRFRADKPDSIVGQELLEQRLTGPRQITDFVIVRSATTTVDDSAFKAYVDELARRIAALGPSVVRSVSTYYQTDDPTVVSRDEHATLIPVVMAGTIDDAVENAGKLHALVVAAQGRGFTIAQTGDASIMEMFMSLAEKDLARGEILGVPAALIVLLIVFGAVLAACMPLLMSIISIVLALALTALIGQVYPMTAFALNILTMMGLAVGIDYTLFVISRYREERALGLAKIDAIAATGATANRAIFFSGMTVVLAMIGMVIIPLDVMISMGVGVMLVVFTTLVTALIALPALLSLLGDRVDALRVPFIGRRATRRLSGGPGIWERLAHSIMRRPVVWLAIAAVALLAAAAPVMMMKSGDSTASAAHLPDSEYAKQGWDILDRDFTLGKANPLLIVIDGQAASPQVKRAVEDLQAAMKSDGDFGPAQVTANEAGDLTLVTTTLAGDPAGEATQSVVKRLREVIVPQAAGDLAGKVYVAGTTAGVVDYLGFFGAWMPVAMAVILSLSFVLLLVAFRSVVIPAQAILMNLLSVGAAYGLMVLVFQKGVGAGLLGLTQVDTIEAWVPLFLFSLLFGLSMDYQVFLLSRIKERYDETGDTREAVAHGLGRTAGIITGAAAIMVCVFGGMATGELVMFQQMGFGLAVAVLIDATIVRTIIVPATMELLGDWNWYLPRWLRWIPDVSVEGRSHEPAAPQEPHHPRHEPGITVRRPSLEGAEH
jgi:RND superfamily putative drug exporter